MFCEGHSSIRLRPGTTALPVGLHRIVMKRTHKGIGREDRGLCGEDLLRHKNISFWSRTCFARRDEYSYGLWLLTWGKDCSQTMFPGFHEKSTIYFPIFFFAFAPVQVSTNGGYSHGNNLMRLIVNIPKNKSKEINLARDQIVTNSREWAGPIFNAHVRMLAANHPVSEMQLLQPSHYLFKLVSFMFFRGLSTEQISDIFPRDEWPFLFLETNGNIGSKRYKEIIHHTIYRSPDPMTRVNAHLIRDVMEDKRIPQLYSFWKGSDTLIDNYATWSGENNDSVILSSLRNLIEESIEISHRFSAVVFLSPPWNGFPPMLPGVGSQAKLG